ncbi:hypothetical protein BGX24_001302 [Mortierella sp. AD032]|nr:hypothetical protein BGX24_001302 [Mortierella sp. AD032]
MATRKHPNLRKFEFELYIENQRQTVVERDALWDVQVLQLTTDDFLSMFARCASFTHLHAPVDRSPGASSPQETSIAPRDPAQPLAPTLEYNQDQDHDQGNPHAGILIRSDKDTWDKDYEDPMLQRDPGPLI